MGIDSRVRDTVTSVLRSCKAKLLSSRIVPECGVCEATCLVHVFMLLLGVTWQPQL